MQFAGYYKRLDDDNHKGEEQDQHARSDATEEQETENSTDDEGAAEQQDTSLYLPFDEDFENEVADSDDMQDGLDITNMKLSATSTIGIVRSLVGSKPGLLQNLFAECSDSQLKSFIEDYTCPDMINNGNLSQDSPTIGLLQVGEAGIYVIEYHLANGIIALYIGQSVSLKKRIYQHMCMTKRHTSNSIHYVAAREAIKMRAVQLMTVPSRVDDLQMAYNRLHGPAGRFVAEVWQSTMLLLFEVYMIVELSTCAHLNKKLSRNPIHQGLNSCVPCGISRTAVGEKVYQSLEERMISVSSQEALLESKNISQEVSLRFTLGIRLPWQGESSNTTTRARTVRLTNPLYRSQSSCSTTLCPANDSAKPSR